NGLGDFAKHPFPRFSNWTRLQLVSFRWLKQRGHLRQPSRGLLAKQIYNRRSFWSAAEPGESIQDWEIGFTCAILFQALSAHDSDFSDVTGLFHKRLNNAGLSYSRFTGHKDNLAFARESSIQPASHFGELVLAA